jgi:hypothetical protein
MDHLTHSPGLRAWRSLHLVPALDEAVGPGADGRAPSETAARERRRLTRSGRRDHAPDPTSAQVETLFLRRARLPFDRCAGARAELHASLPPPVSATCRVALGLADSPVAGARSDERPESEPCPRPRPSSSDARRGLHGDIPPRFGRLPPPRSLPPSVTSLRVVVKKRPSRSGSNLCSCFALFLAPARFTAAAAAL